MSQLRVAWGALAPHANNMEYSLPVHSAQASSANPNNSSDSASLPRGTGSSTLSAACGTRLHAGCDTHPRLVPLVGCAPLDALFLAAD